MSVLEAAFRFFLFKVATFQECLPLSISKAETMFSLSADDVSDHPEKPRE